MRAMIKTCRPIWKRQARETSPYMSGTDSRQSVAFRWRILPRLSRCCANQERWPDHARLTDVGARVRSGENHQHHRHNPTFATGSPRSRCVGRSDHRLGFSDGTVRSVPSQKISLAAPFILVRTADRAKLIEGHVVPSGLYKKYAAP
jgi:hypothetical protein